jgi:kinetochore protein Spc25, fungi type
MQKSSSIGPRLQHWNEVNDQYTGIATHRLTRLQEKEREENILHSRAQEVYHKLGACEETLHGVIEGIAVDQILIRFTHIDPLDLDREFSLVVDVSNKTYKGEDRRSHLLRESSRALTVPTSTPFLPTLPILVDELNRTRDLYNFIKQVWGAFDELTMQE